MAICLSREMHIYQERAQVYLLAQYQGQQLLLQILQEEITLPLQDFLGPHSQVEVSTQLQIFMRQMQ